MSKRNSLSIHILMPSICTRQRFVVVEMITRHLFSSKPYITTSSAWITRHNKQNHTFFVASSLYGTASCTIEIQHAHIFHITCRTCLSNYGSSDWADPILFNAKYLSTAQSNTQHLWALSSKFTWHFNSLVSYATHKRKDISCTKFPIRREKVIS